ncbi:MAG: hypothetical protein KGD64_10645 [Candidatus Heimdallarchaeota archaeon]|nr:hypothetical protein [Candidatus Heimdallarchaeota archaeon]
MLEQNGIPVLALIVEPLVAIGMTILAVSGFIKYFEKRREPTLYLTLSFVFYSLGIACSGIGKWLQFFSNVSPEEIAFAGGTILIAYCLTALATVFLMVFVDLVFLEVGPWFVASVSIINGITLGMMFMKLSFTGDPYTTALYVVIYHALVTLALVLLLAILSFREARQNKERLPKIGFTFIGLYGIFVCMVFVLFAIDIALGGGYSTFYYLAWISAGIGSLCGFVGYIMPDWFKKLLKVQG